MMDERRDLVDREELRREIAEQLKECHAESLSAALWRVVLTLLDAMPAVECPRGWTRDEVLAELDADPDAVCEWLNPTTGGWLPEPRRRVDRWHPETHFRDVRVVRVAPEPEWVPLTQLVGRTMPVFEASGPVKRYQHDEDGIVTWWAGSLTGTFALRPDGQVAVRPKAAT